MNDLFSDPNILDDIMEANSDKYDKVEPDTPLFLDVTFYKKFETIKNPYTGRMMDLDVIMCFEFPQFACLFESNSVDKVETSWKTDVLKEFIDYLKFKASNFAKCLVESAPVWIDDVTARFTLK